MTLAELVADVAARHVEDIVPRATGYCHSCGEDWPCDAARLAAALSVESVAAGLEAHRADAKAWDIRDVKSGANSVGQDGGPGGWYYTVHACLGDCVPLIFAAITEADR
jgi:hypothetical protein